MFNPRKGFIKKKDRSFEEMVKNDILDRMCKKCKEQALSGEETCKEDNPEKWIQIECLEEILRVDDRITDFDIRKEGESENKR